MTILVPGGRVYFEDKYNNDSIFPNKCVPSFQKIYKIALDMNKNRKQYFPIFGICLGFQLLLCSSNDNIQRIEGCNNEENSVPFHILESGKLFENLDMIGNPNVRYNQIYRILEETLKNSDWNILSTAEDRDGNKFVAAVEHKDYPFFGVQFHPEKSMEIQEDNN
uniref:Glutamine amidotransferase domain-containing protein n=1 Tax=Megaselia scalaris TaxID=36166 RepID=T1GLF5_MEGSC